MESWQIQGKTITFDEATHTYTVNGKKCISVTQLLHFKFPKKYDGIDPAVLERAAEKGTAMHQAIQDYEEVGIEFKEMQEFRDYLFLKKSYKFECIASEKPILLEYKNLFVCGRLDQVIKYKDKLCINDFKRTATLDKEYLAYQLNLYRLAYIQSYKENIEGCTATHLREGKRKFMELPVNEEMTYALLDAYKKERIKMTKEKAISIVEDLIYKLAGWAGTDICDLEEEYDFKLDEVMAALRGDNNE